MDALIDYRGKTPRKVDAGIPLITAKIVKNGRIQEPTEFISPSDFDDWMTRGLPRIGDVVLTTEAPLGEVAQIGQLPVALAQRIVTLRGKRGLVDNDFLLYALQSEPMQTQMKGRSSGTTVLGIKQSELRKIVLAIPPMEQQQLAASVLKALDARISLLEETNATLEAIAHTLFKAWFVDFDPVHAKAEGREPDGMDAATAALFPDSFEDSPRGPIPQGWHAASLSDCMELNPQRVLRKGSLASYLDMANAPTQGHRPAEITQRELGSGSKFINGDTLLAKITPCLENGKTAFVDFLADNEVGWGSTEFIVMRPKAPLPPFWGYLLARTPNFRAFAIQAMTGTSGRQRVELGRLKQFSVAVPDDGVAEAFGKIIEPLHARIAAASSHADNLTQLRDTLLPRLISGKLRLPEVSGLTEEAIA